MDSHSWEGRICLGDNPSGQRQVFWICGSLDAGVAAGTDIRSDPCAAFSTSHELNIVPLAPAMGLGVKSLGALLVRKGR